MKLIKPVILVFWILVVSIQTLVGQDGIPAFVISNSKGKSVKKLTVRFVDATCGADSLAKYNASSGSYTFDCFPTTRTNVFFEAPGYNRQALNVSESDLKEVILVKLQKKGAQEIKIEDSEYKYWELHNVIYLKEKEGKAYKLQQLIESLNLIESPYYGINFYEHKDKIDFNALNDTHLKEFRKSGLALVAAPVILLFKERTKDDKKFRPINKLLPLPNILEFGKSDKPSPAMLQAFSMEEVFVYPNQWSPTSPRGYQTMSQGLGLDVLALINSLDQMHPDIQVKCLDITSWYSLLEEPEIEE